MTKDRYMALADFQSLWTDTLKPFISQNYAPLSGLSSVVRDTTSGAKTIASAAVNTVYSYATISGLTVTALAAPTDTAVPAEYVFEFTLGSTVGTMSFPASVVWPESGEPEWQANKHYRVVVLYNAGDGNYYARCYDDLAGRVAQAGYVPTLQSAPTSSTTTYTKDEQTVNFEIGQFCRVVDVTMYTGYKFYQLADLQSNGTVAIWQDMGTPLEKLTLSVTSNNASLESSLRSSAVITVTDENQNEIFRGMLLQAKTLQLFPGVSYTVTAAAVTGYITPQSQTFTAEYEGIRSIQMQYDTTVLTVTLSSDTGEADLSNVTVTVTDTTTSSTVSAQQNGTYLIPVGHGFTVDVSDNVTGYNAPAAYNGTATGTAASVIMTYEQQPPKYVDLGLPSGKKWAIGNLVKDSQGNYSIGEETDWGTYVSWGNIIGHNEGEGYDFRDAIYNSTPGKQVGANIPSNDAAHDIALATLGSPWHLPTKEDFQELYNNTDSEWVDDYNGTGVAGRKFMKKSDHSIYVFFPASGFYSGTSIGSRGTSGDYWSSSLLSAKIAYYLDFSSSVDPQSSSYRSAGFTVRPVQ